MQFPWSIKEGDFVICKTQDENSEKIGKVINLKFGHSGEIDLKRVKIGNDDFGFVYHKKYLKKITNKSKIMQSFLE